MYLFVQAGIGMERSAVRSMFGVETVMKVGCGEVGLQSVQWSLVDGPGPKVLEKAIKIPNIEMFTRNFTN